MRRLRASVVGIAILTATCGGDGGNPGAPTNPGSPAPAPSATPGPPGTPAVMPGTAIPQTGPADLTVSYVERLPKTDYVVDATDPATQGWPEPGSPVTWRAHLRNWTTHSLDGVDYSWTLDGAAAGSGTLTLPGGSDTTLDLPWTWDRSRHRLELTLDASNRFTVPGGRRNHLVVYTDALAVGLYVEHSVYDYFRQFQHELRIGNSCFEDWAHLQIELWNQMLESATWPDTPQGVLDRVRLDAVHVVPDGALPLDPLAFALGGAFAAPQARPDVADRTIDMQWGFPITVLDSDVYQDHSSLQTNNQFYYSGFVQHEMGHARYLVDVYAWDVYDGTAGSRIEITEGGEHVAGSRYMPGSSVVFNGVEGIRAHRTAHQGLMTSEWRYLDDYSAAALNLIAGHRALDGNYNEPANLGQFLNDLPRQNSLFLRDADGAALANAQVQVFQAAPGDQSGQSVYTKLYDATPDLDLRADGDGVVQLGENPFSSDGPVELHDLFANGTIVLRVEHEGRVGYGFLESSDFNLEYWRGHRDLGQHTLTVTLF
jgi:hypothetical protein